MLALTISNNITYASTKLGSYSGNILGPYHVSVITQHKYHSILLLGFTNCVKTVIILLNLLSTANNIHEDIYFSCATGFTKYTFLFFLDVNESLLLEGK